MLRNYLKISIRHLLKNKITAGINIFGLGIGIAACLVIWQYVQLERSYDRFFPDAERIYRVNLAWGNAEQQERYATSPPPLAETIAKDIPEVEAVARVYNWSDFTMRPDDNFDKVFRETNVYAVNEHFFDIFPYKILEGNAQTAFAEPASIVLPRSAAIRYFGAAAVARGSIVGRKILGGKDAGTPWTVTAVIEDVPENAHFQFEFLISSITYPDDLHRNQMWDWAIMYTYVKFREELSGTKLAQVQAKMNQLAQDYVVPYMGATEEQPAADEAFVSFPMQALTDIHLNSNYMREMGPNGSLAYVNTLTIIALFIMLLACINYINLFTAHSTVRAKEVGVKKVIGAEKKQLVVQFLTESLVLCGIATLLGIALMKGFYWGAEQLSLDLNLKMLWSNQQILLISIGIALTVGLLAGTYPALYMTRFQPIQVLKDSLPTGLQRGNLRNALVVFQFVISIGLIAATLIVNLQVDYFQNKQLGFNEENVLIIQNDREIEEQREAFKQILTANPDVLHASFSNGIPGLQSYHARDFRTEDATAGQAFNWFQIDENYIETMDVNMTAGRGFADEMASDTFGVIFNEAAIRALGIQGDPIGQQVIKNVGAPDEQTLRIIGVTEDFHYESLHHEVRPLAMQFLEGFVFKDYISVRLAGDDLRASVAFVQDTWTEFEPQVPMVYSFLDENLDQLFKSEQRLSDILSVFTGLALFIACLGLYGLVLFMLERRKKEISIRKIVGASARDILLLLNKNFLRLTLIAFAIATPIVWYAMSRWLENFAYRISLPWWVFLLAGFGVMAIALFTVSLQAILTATGNPVDSIRTE